MRFSLTALLGFVALVAVGCAAMSHPTELWVTIIESGTLALLGFGALVAMHGRGPWRPFWSGFTLIGASYLLLVAALECYGDFQYQYTGYLVTCRLKQWYCERAIVPYTEAWRSAQIIGEFLWAVALGFVSGIVARQIAARCQ